MAKNVKVYSTSTCSYCVMLKKFLQENNIQFENIDVGMDPQAGQEMMTKSGQMGVPVVDIEGEIIVGFDKEKIAKTLGI
ncbi:MAG: glutaredoxin domain-containing protein [Candidatus Omnitrophota bacterium]